MEAICLVLIFRGSATQVGLFYFPLSCLCMGRDLDGSIGKGNLEGQCVTIIICLKSLNDQIIWIFKTYWIYLEGLKFCIWKAPSMTFHIQKSDTFFYIWNEWFDSNKDYNLEISHIADWTIESFAVLFINYFLQPLAVWFWPSYLFLSSYILHVKSLSAIDLFLRLPSKTEAIDSKC